MNTECLKAVPSLFELLISFVCRYIYNVTVLRGLPEVIGKQLAEGICRQGVMTTLDQAEYVLRLFLEAYGNQVLYSLNLNSYSLLQMQETSSKVYKQLVSPMRGSIYNILSLHSLINLDISYCSNIRDKKWLSLIGQMNLIELKMGRVGLTDADVQVLLTCASVRKSGLVTLESLDLSGNNITRKSLTRIEKLPYISKVAVGETFIKAEHINVKFWKIQNLDSNGHLNSKCMTISTEGWFTHPLAKLLANEVPVEHSKFYRKPVSSTCHGESTCCRLDLIRISNISRQSKRSIDNSEQLQNQSKKRKVLTSEVTDEETSLLSLYS